LLPRAYCPNWRWTALIGRYPNPPCDYAKIQVRMIKDRCLALLPDDGRRDLLEILDDCHNRQFTVVICSLLVSAWNAYSNEPTPG
jgi:hypothetical protein